MGGGSRDGGAFSLGNFDESLGFCDPQGLPQAESTDSQSLSQFFFGGKFCTGCEPLVQDEGMEELDDLVDPIPIFQFLDFID